MASRESSSKSRSGKPLHSVDLPVFVISVAAELAGMHPQTLRQYDRIGLVQPSRAPGKARRYSQRDVNRLQQIQQLSQEGVSLEGIRRIIELESLVEAQQEQIAALQPDLGVVTPWMPRENIDAIRELNVPVVVCKSAATMEDIHANIRLFASAAGEPERGEKLIGKMEDKLAEIRAKLAQVPEEKKHKSIALISPSW